ncbi:stimulator of interferon genes [Podarcis lilfordi]|uniref:Stimulator of interferon genes protein n=1 Tax=Podarcis lilfordi TaxID=74358 RepID=A0AA35KLQ3_9SAUR|nr:stimulator of interferon genes [Podarcis lilfordi]
MTGGLTSPEAEKERGLDLMNQSSFSTSNCLSSAEEKQTETSGLRPSSQRCFNRLNLCFQVNESFKQNSHIWDLGEIERGIPAGWSAVSGACNFAEELRHVTSRYHGSYLRALNACLELRKRSFLFLLLCGVAYLHLKESDRRDLIIVCFCQLLNFVFDLEHPSAAELSEMYERNNCNVAQGLAWSYYVGYLKFILPGLKDRIREFNQSNSHLLNCEKTWKLHILIPLSCDVCDDLQTVDSHIHFIKNLPELNMDVAGIKKRSYKNSIYGILGENKEKHFCVMEYATPLRSLFAMSQDESAAFSYQDRLEQAKLFCRALEEILQRSKYCSGCYRLIVYDDSEENDKHFLSKTILRHMEQELQEEYTMDEKYEGSIHNAESNGTQLLISGSDHPMSLHSFGY